MLRIAVPNKGSLADASAEILKEAGYRQRVDARDLVLIDPENNVEFYYLRPRDIAIYRLNDFYNEFIESSILCRDCGGRRSGATRWSLRPQVRWSWRGSCPLSGTLTRHGADSPMRWPACFAPLWTLWIKVR